MTQILCSLSLLLVTQSVPGWECFVLEAAVVGVQIHFIYPQRCPATVQTLMRITLHRLTIIGITQPTLSESVMDIRGLSSLKSPVYRIRLTTSHSSSSRSKRSMTEPGQWWEGTAVVRSL